MAQTYGSGRLKIDQERIKAFAAETTTLNQKGEPVQVFIGNLIVPRRPAT